MPESHRHGGPPVVEIVQPGTPQGELGCQLAEAVGERLRVPQPPGQH